MERIEVVYQAAIALRQRGGAVKDSITQGRETKAFQAKEFVEHLCDLLGLELNEGEHCLKMLGGAYSRVQLWRWNNPDLGGEIWLHPNLTPEKRAFAIAHELGHFTLHRGERIAFHPPCTEAEVNEQADPGNLRHQDHRIEEYSPRARRELEANAFAAELLAPCAEVRRLFSLLPGCNADMVAEYFGISSALAQQRLMDAVLSARPTIVDRRPSQPFSSPVGNQTNAPTADDLIAHLDPYQKEAARASGPALVIAGPGTGKTATLAGRVAHLVTERGIPPERILALTFSNRAAGEMRERLERYQLPHERLPVMTIHAFAANLLREYASRVPCAPGERKLEPDFRILDEPDAFLLMETLLGELPLRYYRSLNNPTEHLRNLIIDFSRARDKLLSPDEYLALVAQMPPQPKMEADEETDELTRNKKGRRAKSQPPAGTYTPEDIARARERAMAYAVWDRALRQRGLVDFGGLIQRAVELLRANPEVLTDVQQRYPEILVDEFQDTNYAQGVLLLLIAGARGHGLWVVGDRNQSVYRWRGASPANLTRLVEQYPTLRRFHLRRCYRSVPSIVTFGSAIAARMAGYLAESTDSAAPVSAEPSPAPSISHEVLGPLEAHRQEERIPAVLRCDGFFSPAHEQAGLIEAIQRYRAQGYSYHDQAILCRKNSHVHQIAAALAAQGIPVKQTGYFFERPEIKDVLALLTLAAGPDARAILRARELIPCLGYPIPTAEELAALAQSLVPTAQQENTVLNPTTRAALSVLIETARKLRYNSTPEESHLASKLADFLLRPQGYAWQLVRIAEGLPITSQGQAKDLPLPAAATPLRAQSALAALGELLRIATQFDARWKHDPDFRSRLSRMVQRQQPKTSSVPTSRQTASKIIESEGGVTSPQEKDTPDEVIQLAPAVSCFLHYVHSLHMTDAPIAVSAGDEDTVQVMTLHTSKGLEFPVVYLPTLAQGQFPPGQPFQDAPAPPGLREIDLPGEAEAEERCLFYVGVTRARDVVVLTRATSYTKGKIAQPSMLLDLVEGALPNGQIQPLFSDEELERLAAMEAAADDQEDEEEEHTSLPAHLKQRVATSGPSKRTYTLSELEQYQRCPRQYKYARYYGLRDASQDAAMRFHRYIRRGRVELRDAHAAKQDGRWEEVEQRLRACWEEDGPAGHAYDSFYWRHAQSILRQEWNKLNHKQAHEGLEIALAQELTVELNRCLVRVHADCIAGGPGPASDPALSKPTVLTRVHARPPYMKDEEDPHLPLYYLAHQQQAPNLPVRIEVAYLGDVLADVAAIPGVSPQSDVVDMTAEAHKDASKYLKPGRKQRSRLDKLDEAALGIEAGWFPPKPDERRCRACPYYYLCPADLDAN